MIYGAGLRVSEACGLDVGDIEVDGGRVYVRVRQGKGRKDRVVPVGGKARAALDAWSAQRTKRLAAAPTGTGGRAGGRRGAVRHADAGCAWARARCAGCSLAASR